MENNDFKVVVASSRFAGFEVHILYMTYMYYSKDRYISNIIERLYILNFTYTPLKHCCGRWLGYCTVPDNITLHR